MDNQDWLLVSLWVHVPFITAWIGLVMLDTVAVFAPGLEGVQRRRLLLWSRVFVLIAIPVIMATGIWQTIENPFFRVEAYSGLKELRDRTLYGDLLFWKHGFVLATFGLTILVRFILAPRLPSEPSMGMSGGAATMEQTATGTLRLVQLATVLNLASCLGAVLLATRMVAELH
ncbi:MAG: hypothetical protein GEU75_05545 [Dehalococcoidia bacterium]|nr:hypothetical protein [Dehalococcoidia bacterium]